MSRFKRVLQPILLLFRSTELKELEIVVLHHQLAVPRRQVGKADILVRRQMVLGGVGADVAQGPRTRWMRRSDDDFDSVHAVTAIAPSSPGRDEYFRNLRIDRNWRED